jgi:hypothetical protein
MNALMTPELSIRELLKQPAGKEELEASVRAPTPKMIAPVIAPPERLGQPVAKVLVIWSKGPHDYELEYHRYADGTKRLYDAPVHLKSQLHSHDPNKDKAAMRILGYELVSFTTLL